MSARMYYVCDRCGLSFEHERSAMLNCPSVTCQSVALWEFTNKRKALEHSEHIKRGAPLFRSKS